MNGHLVAKNSAESLLKHQKLVVKHTYTHTQSFSEMIIQYIHRTCWRLAWGKQLLIASNPLQFVWDHLSGLLCFSVVTLWKPIGWQLMYGLLQSPQPGPRDPATPFSPCLLSFASVLSYYFLCPVSASRSVLFQIMVLGVCIFQERSVSLIWVGVGVREQETVYMCWVGRLEISTKACTLSVLFKARYIFVPFPESSIK